MIAPRYINTSIIDQLSVEQSRAIHCNKLKKIKLQGSGLYQYNPSEPIHFPHLKNRWKSTNSSNFYLVKTEQITQQNLKMLNKILDISTQKSISSGKSCGQWKKSLNIEERIKEAKRIERDNQSIVLRLAKQKPDYVTDELKKEYRIFKKFKNRLSKVKVLENRKGKSAKKMYFKTKENKRKLGKSSSKAQSPFLKSYEEEKDEMNDRTFWIGMKI